MSGQLPLLVVGGTGALGQQVVDALIRRGRSVRALVRPGSDARVLQRRGVEVVRGDMLDPASLRTAMTGVDALITSAVGYTRRRKGDTTETDTAGNRNLVDAAKIVGLRRFVFTGILTADKAREVPHFWHKAVTERYLADSGVPYVSLRPGAFLDQVMALLPGGVSSGWLLSLGSPDVPLTYVLSADVADALAAAADAPAMDGEHIDLGWDRPVSLREVAAITSDLVGRRISVRAIPWPVLNTALGVVGRFSEQAAETRQMVKYFQSGRFVADPTRQQQVLGAVPRAEQALTRWLTDQELLPAGPSR
jgi:uncharacterized protein YbjT (DUF2867 family)